MVTRFFALDGQTRLRAAQPEETVDHPSRLHRIYLIGLIWLMFTLLVLAVMTLARMRPIPQPPDLSASHYPGNPLPDQVACNPPTERHFSCYTYGDDDQPPWGSYRHLDMNIYYIADLEEALITSTFIPADGYSLGDLILAWGTPSGILQTQATSYISWDTRTAYLYTGSPQPHSPVTYILYETEPKQASPWRGFRLPAR